MELGVRTPAPGVRKLVTAVPGYEALFTQVLATFDNLDSLAYGRTIRFGLIDYGLPLILGDFGNERHRIILSGRHGSGLAHADLDHHCQPMLAGNLRVAAAVGAVAGLDGGIVLVGVGFAEEDPQRPIESLTVDFPLA